MLRTQHNWTPSWCACHGSRTARPRGGGKRVDVSQDVRNTSGFQHMLHTSSLSCREEPAACTVARGVTSVHTPQSWEPQVACDKLLHLAPPPPPPHPRRADMGWTCMMPRTCGKPWQGVSYLSTHHVSREQLDVPPLPPCATCRQGTDSHDAEDVRKGVAPPHAVVEPVQVLRLF
jgi:hypothetical protein